MGPPKTNQSSLEDPMKNQAKSNQIKPTQTTLETFYYAKNQGHNGYDRHGKRKPARMVGPFCRIDFLAEGGGRPHSYEAGG